MNEVRFNYEAARYNNVNGYIAAKWELEEDEFGFESWVYVGKQFGKTKQAAREAFDFDAEDYFS